MSRPPPTDSSDPLPSFSPQHFHRAAPPVNGNAARKFEFQRVISSYSNGRRHERKPIASSVAAADRCAARTPRAGAAGQGDAANRHGESQARADRPTEGKSKRHHSRAAAGAPGDVRRALSQAHRSKARHIAQHDQAPLALVAKVLRRYVACSARRLGCAQRARMSSMKPCADACGRFRYCTGSYCRECQSRRNRAAHASRYTGKGSPWRAWRPGWLSRSDDPNRKAVKP